MTEQELDVLDQALTRAEAETQALIKIMDETMKRLAILEAQTRGMLAQLQGQVEVH